MLEDETIICKLNIPPLLKFHIFFHKIIGGSHIHGSVQDCSNSIANAMEFWAKPSTWNIYVLDI